MKDKKDRAELLLEWFKENKREMPWRKTKDPYCIWVSEVMLQQTQVATVIPYYLRFMERFPTICELAQASLEEVHTYWQGLGYYRRGENLWKGAKVIAERWNGEFPVDPKLVSEIPGIGPYTLGAISSIAYGLPLPAVDGNVMRVMSRWYYISDDIAVARNRKIFEDKVMENMPNDPGSFNQALMELGALICTPKNPMCEKCPVEKLCMARQQGREEQFPVKSKKVKPALEQYYVLVIEKDGKIGLIKRPSEGILANLWGLPMLAFEEWQKGEWESKQYIKLEEVTHVFTHRKWQMTPIYIKWSSELQDMLNKEFRLKDMIQYIAESKIEEVPIATAFKKILKKILVISK